jgi:hypothetical protein
VTPHPEREIKTIGEVELKDRKGIEGGKIRGWREREGEGKKRGSERDRERGRFGDTKKNKRRKEGEQKKLRPCKDR